MVEKTVVAVNLLETQAVKLKQLSGTLDTSVSELVRVSVDDKMNEINSLLDERAEATKGKEREIEKSAHDFVEEARASSRFPQDYDFDFIIDKSLLIVEGLDLGKGNYGFKILCDDCRDRQKGFFSGDLAQMAAGVHDGFDTAIFGGTLNEGYAALRMNSMLEVVHRHRRFRPNKETRDGLRPIDTHLKIEVILKREIREKLEADYVSTWRKIQALKHEIAKLSPEQILTGAV